MPLLKINANYVSLARMSSFRSMGVDEIPLDWRIFREG